MPDWAIVAVVVLGLIGLFLLLRRSTPLPKKPRGRQIAIDGTNVLFWRDETAQLATLQTVLKHLRQKGFDPVVFLDASSRHHIGDKSLNERKFAQVLGLPQNRIMVCPARTEADAFILEFAGAQKLSVVTNDRFRDRPNAARNVPLVKGHFRGDKLVLKGL